jgi:3-oxoisoapionate decarboxylase
VSFIGIDIRYQRFYDENNLVEVHTLKLGISTYTLPWAFGVKGYPNPKHPFHIHDLIDLAVDFDCAVVQLADNVPLSNLSDATLEEICSHAKDRGIAIEIGTRGTEPSLLLDHLSIAEKLGASVCRTLIVDDTLSEAEANFRKVLPQFESSSVSIAVENYGLQSADELRDLFTRVDSAFLGSCPDTSNSVRLLEDPEYTFQQLVPSAKSIHLKDYVFERNTHQFGYIVGGAPLGSGLVSLANIVSIINRLAVENTSVVIELWPPYQGSIDETVELERQWMKQSLEALKQQIEQGQLA